MSFARELFIRDLSFECNNGFVIRSIHVLQTQETRKYVLSMAYTKVHLIYCYKDAYDSFYCNICSITALIK
jgi:hypothetical protein